MPFGELWPHLAPFLAAVGLDVAEPPAEGGRLRTAIELHRPRAADLADLAAQLVPYFRDRLEYDPEVAGKYRDDHELPGRLAALRERYGATEPFAVEPLEAALRELAEAEGVKAAYLIHPLRMALSGTKAGPPVFDLVAVTGRQATLDRLEHFGAWLAGGGAE
jgi:glutamyl/glutaminyl-tRNA synthetase